MRVSTRVEYGIHDDNCYRKYYETVYTCSTPACGFLNSAG